MFDSKSPLLSLDKPVLKHLIEYLEEEGLASLAEASTTVKQKFEDEAAFELEIRRLEQNVPGFFPIPWKGDVRTVVGVDRARIFGKAASYARKMEKLAANHYNYDQVAIEKSSPERFYSEEERQHKERILYEDMEVHCDGCEELDRQSKPSLVVAELGREDCHAVSLRLSYRSTQGNNDPLIWEGFVPSKKNQYFFEFDGGFDEYGRLVCDGDDFAEIILNLDSVVNVMHWPEIDRYMERLDNSTRALSDEEKRQSLKDIASNLQLTAVLVTHMTPPYYWDTGIHEIPLCGRLNK